MEAVLGLAVATTLVLLLIAKMATFRREAGVPPAKRGWIPWVGVAIQFGKEPLHYIEKTKREVGTVVFDGALYIIFAAEKSSIDQRHRNVD